MFAKFISQLIYVAAIQTLSFQIFALEITVKDINGEPITGAVIAIPNGLDMFSKLDKPVVDTAIMDQVDYQFLPKTLVIQKDQWVDFPNSDDVRHHVYSFSSAKPFEIKLFSGSEAQPVQFNQVGIVVMGCNIHDSMVGYIYVADTQHTAMTDELGQTKITVEADVIDGTTANIAAKLWHPLLSVAQTERIDIELNPRLAQQVIQVDSIDQSKVIKAPQNGFSSKLRGSN